MGERSLLRRPVVHVVAFGLLLGLALVVVKGPPTEGEENRRIVITAGDLLQLRAAFMRTWQREPTQMELRGALSKYIREEVLYREALARGYDRDDVVVRRAMQRKMEFLAESQGLREPPSEEEIQAYFALRQERYRIPALVSFVQVYLNPDARGSSAEADAQRILAELRAAEPASAALVEWGDRIMLEPYYAEQTEQQIRALFGDSFAASVLELPPGDWQGPIPSGYGLHLVKVTRRLDSRIPGWREVRQRVLSDMEYEARNAAREQLYQEIAQGYQVLLDEQVRDLVESAEP
jgi:hypothetical protein